MPLTQNSTLLKQYLESGIETVSLDFKGSHPLDKPALQELVKDIFAMANLRNGGVIVVGVDEADGRFQNNGMKAEDLEVFKADDLTDLVGRCASSAVSFSSQILNHDGKQYLLIQVEEFEELPVICSCDQQKTVQHGVNKDKVCIFRPGDIFIRTRESRPATRLVRSHIETKDLIELAVDKTLRRLHARGLGLVSSSPTPDLEAALAGQGQDLLS